MVNSGKEWRFMDSLMSKEELKCYIKNYNGMKFIKHPLMNEMVFGELDQVIPESFKKAILPKGLDAKTFGDAYVQKINFKQVQLDEAIKQQNWDKVFMLIEKPFRLNWLEENVNLFQNERAYYSFLKDAYMMTEFPMNGFYNYRDLLDLFYAKDDPKLMMDVYENTMLQKLSNEIEIWRGIKVDDEIDMENIGLSFTLDKEKAIWFAERFAKEGFDKSILIKAVIKKKHIIAIFLDRFEDEIIVNPEDIKIKEIIEL
jgi:hypothetical protein